MLIDHIGVILPGNPAIFRNIGRLSMPIFAYMIARGYDSTQKRGTTSRYVISLCILAVVSMFPHFIFKGSFELNIIIAWIIAIGVLSILKTPNFTTVACSLMLVAFCNLINLEYYFLGVSFVLLFYFSKVKKNRPWLRYIGTFFLLVVYVAITGYQQQANAMYALPLIDLITWLEEKKSLPRVSGHTKYLFYIFYPAHLMVLCLIRDFAMR